MVSSNEDTLAEFKQIVAMPTEELETELNGTECVHRMVEILRKNPDKEIERYTEEDFECMREVLSHIKKKGNSKENDQDEPVTESNISLEGRDKNVVETLEKESSVESCAVAGQNSSSETPENGKSGQTPINDEVKQDAEGPKEAKKRKLDADDTKSQNVEDADEPHDGNDVDGVETNGEQTHDVGGIEGQSPPRKKNKNNGVSNAMG